MKRKLFAETNSKVSLYFNTMILLQPILFFDSRNFGFCSITQVNLTLSAYIINYKTTNILIKNIFNRSLRIFYGQKLDHTVNIYYNNCFFAKTKFMLQAIVFSLKATSFFKHQPCCKSTCNNLSIETKLDNSIKVYKDKQTVILLAQFMAKYLFIKKFEEFV